MDVRPSAELLTSLKVIAAIRQHERVATCGVGEIRIEAQSGLVTSLMRFLRGESRSENMTTIETIVDRALRSRCPRVDAELIRAAEGLERLRCTYEHDSLTTAKIDVCVDRIRSAMGWPPGLKPPARKPATRKAKEE